MVKRVQQSFECDSPPCIHVVVDERKKVFKVFLEDYEVIAPIPLEKVVAACESVRRLREMVSREGFREAEGDEVDRLARRYLRAEPYEEEVEG